MVDFASLRLTVRKANCARLSLAPLFGTASPAWQSSCTSARRLAGCCPSRSLGEGGLARLADWEGQTDGTESVEAGGDPPWLPRTPSESHSPQWPGPPSAPTATPAQGGSGSGSLKQSPPCLGSKVAIFVRVCSVLQKMRDLSFFCLFQKFLSY